MILQNLDDSLMATAAHRYCLGRQSYIVGACLDWLKATWEQFDSNTKCVMLRDTIEAIQHNRAGSPTIDVPGWQNFVDWARPTLTKEQEQWLREAIR